MSFRIVQMELSEANAFVRCVHRHHEPVVGHRFSIGAADHYGVLRGVIIAGRPVARKTNPRAVLEVTRLATDGARNACSFLYSAAARVAKNLGYERIQTFILAEEHGTTLRAAGWVFLGLSKGGTWKRSDGAPRRNDQPTGPKQLWGKHLNPPRAEPGVFG